MSMFDAESGVVAPAINANIKVSVAVTLTLRRSIVLVDGLPREGSAFVALEVLTAGWDSQAPKTNSAAVVLLEPNPTTLLEGL